MMRDLVLNDWWFLPLFAVVSYYFGLFVGRKWGKDYGREIGYVKGWREGRISGERYAEYSIVELIDEGRSTEYIRSIISKD